MRDTQSVSKEKGQNQMTHDEIAQTLTRAEMIDMLAERTLIKKNLIVRMSTNAIVEQLASTFEVVILTPKVKKAKKTTRTCKICGHDKPLDEFGPTHKQVACKGACLKEYTKQALARAKARKVATQQAEVFVHANVLSEVYVAPKLVLLQDLAFDGPSTIYSSTGTILTQVG